MIYERKVIESKDLLSFLQDYKYCLIYSMSKVYLGLSSEMSDINSEEILEARFFDENGETHTFYDEDDLIAVTYPDDQQLESYNPEKIVVRKNLQSAGNNLFVKKYIDYDKDGQAYICLTRCYSLGGEAL